MSEWPQQNDEGIKQRNIACLRQAMELLYESHITDESTAQKRGEAIRAIDAMLKDLGIDDAIIEMEAIPWSKRMRDSEVWK